MSLTNPAAQNFVTTTNAEKGLQRFTKVTWSYNGDSSVAFKLVRTQLCFLLILLSKFNDCKRSIKGILSVFCHVILQ